MMTYIKIFLLGFALAFITGGMSVEAATEKENKVKPTQSFAIPKFSNIQAHWDSEISQAFSEFSSVCETRGYKKPIDGVAEMVNYIAYLTTFSADESTANVLDYLIKTGGPNGIGRQANPWEQFILETALASAVTTNSSLAKKIYDNKNSQIVENQIAIAQNIQKIYQEEKAQF